jgi:hypothetical protein
VDARRVECRAKCPTWGIMQCQIKCTQHSLQLTGKWPAAAAAATATAAPMMQLLVPAAAAAATIIQLLLAAGGSCGCHVATHHPGDEQQDRQADNLWPVNAQVVASDPT